MLFTTHSIAGAALGMVTGNPYEAFALGILSHHAMDALPHFDQGSFYTAKTRARWLGQEGIYHEHSGFSQRDWKVLYADWMIAGVLFLVIALIVPVVYWPAIIGGALGGIAPDILDSSPLWSEKLRKKSNAVRKYNVFHSFFHWTVPMTQFWIGLLTQLVIIAVSLFYLLTPRIF